MATLLRYCGVAGAAAFTDWVVFISLDLVGMPHVADLVCARIAGGLFSFVANRSWSFRTLGLRRPVVQGRRFLLLYAASFSLAVGLFWSLINVLRLPIYPSKLATDTTCFFFNYGVMKTYVFHGRAGLTDLLHALVGRRRKRASSTPASTRSSR